MNTCIELTADRSATLFVPELNEHYHSMKGARTESQHIFIDMGLHHVRNLHPCVLEIGFGTGLNAFLSLLAANESQRKTHYTGIELYPLAWNTVQELNYTDNPLFHQIHAAPWETETLISPHFTLLKKNVDFTKLPVEINQNPSYDVVYFDAFAPEKQPEMWSQQCFDHLYAMMNPGGIITTYCAKGTVRRMLQAAGFVTERLPGPPGGKREILRGRKAEN